MLCYDDRWIIMKASSDNLIFPCWFLENSFNQPNVKKILLQCKLNREIMNGNQLLKIRSDLELTIDLIWTQNIY